MSHRYNSEGHRLFAAALEKERGLAARVADALGCHPSMVSRIKASQADPDAKDLWTIEQVTGVAPIFWSQPPKADIEQEAS